MRAIQWCSDRQGEIFREPAGDRIRDVEILEWQIGKQITVSQTGFGGSDGRMFETAEVSTMPRRLRSVR